MSSAFVRLVGLLIIPMASPALAQQVEQHDYDALGRLAATDTDGGINNGENRSQCYDPAGNRTFYRSETDGTAANCAAPPAQNLPGSDPPPPPAPSPTPPSANTPPVATDDAVSGPCGGERILNITANDRDAENQTLRIISLTLVGGPSVIEQASDSSVYISFGGGNRASTIYDYVVADSSGATDTGRITATTSCDGYGQPL